MPPPVYAAGPENYSFALPVRAMTFSQDGQQLFVSGYHEVTVWNVSDGKLINRIRNVGQRTVALALLPMVKRSRSLAERPVASAKRRLFQVATGELKGVFASSPDLILDVVFNPQGDRFATGGADGAIRVFEIATGKELSTITSHSDWVLALAFNADGTKLASASRDKTAKVYDLATGDLLVTYSGHGAVVKGIVFQPEGADVYSSGADNKIHRWTIAEGKKVSEAACGGEVYKLTLSGDLLFAFGR